MHDLAARSTLVGLAAALVLSVLIVAGSHAFTYFDPAVTPYAVATLVAAGAVAWRFAVWLARPATRLYWRRGWELGRTRQSKGHKLAIPHTMLRNVLSQLFILNRSRLRWVMHFTLAWGCGIAFLLTVPLVFGWLHFEALPGDLYRLRLFGLPTIRFPVPSLLGFLVFSGLNMAALLVLTGCGIALWLRLTGRGIRAHYQEFVRDYLPLITLVMVAVTGLALSVDAHWLGGRFYLLAAVAHELSVVFLLLYFPFSKLFHAVQRPAAIGVDLYHRVAQQHGGHRCPACGRPFGLTMQVQDVQEVLAEGGATFRRRDGSRWQDLCIKCRRLERARRFQAMAGNQWV